MGKAGRVACIFLPMALTIASFVCMIFIELGGWNSNSTSLNSLYFMKANFTNLSISGASDLANTTELTVALELAQTTGLISDVYEIHLWNYCTSNYTNGTIDYCSDRKAGFVFDPVTIWGLNSSNVPSTGSASADNAIASAINSAKNDTEAFEGKLLGKAGKDALDTYKKVAKWMFIAYEVAFWTTLATIVVGLLAICSRWGSLLTWIFSIVSTLMTFAASLTASLLFPIVAGSLHTILHPYGVKVSVGGHVLAISWISTVLSIAATLFWLFSICCCSGRSNPHHKDNKGGLWNAEPKGMGYDGDYNGRRSMRVEKTGGGYQRVSDPYMGAENDRVPLQEYPQPQAYGRQMHPGGAYEPFRHN